MRESVIEKKVKDHAKSKGFLVYKFVSPNQKGVPDSIFVKSGTLIMIEFKALGKKPTKLQDSVISKLRNEGMKVYVIDNVADGKALIDKYN